ncbi:fructose 1,6-bisphosphatase, partial [bacterium]|nr:fructose 1,6-bisphosphatase [bacterium]
MNTTLSIIKADIGSIGGHIKPSQRLMERVREYLKTKGGDLFTDCRVSST